MRDGLPNDLLRSGLVPSDHHSMEHTVKIKPSELDIIEETNQYPVRGGWIWNVVIAREPDGTVACWEIPLRRMGGTR